MTSKDMYLPKWFERGLTYVCDILKPNGLIMTIDEITHRYSFPSINHLHYLRVQRNVKELIKNMDIKIC